MNKKRLLHRLLKFLFDRDKNIFRVVFFAPVRFHALHLEPVLKYFESLENFEVILVGEFSKCKYKDVKNIAKLEDLPLSKNYSAFVCTDLYDIWWLDGTKIFFGHGIGPKLDYQTSSALTLFDYVFCPCKPIFEVQKPIAKSIVKVGLPLLDTVNINEAQIRNVKNGFDLKNGLKTLVYAPSWNKDENLISDIELIIEKLSLIKELNIIVSPHPNLLNPLKFSKTKIFENTPLLINRPSSEISTFEICALSDLVISDISSILFEAMALGKPVAFDGNDRVYKSSGAEGVLRDLVLHSVRMDWQGDIENQLQQCFNEQQRESVEKFISQYLFNKGSACDVFINQLLMLSKA